jgi:hypothetical protein
MDMKRPGFILAFFYLLPLSFFFATAVTLFTSGYDDFIGFLGKTIEKPDWDKFIRLHFSLSAFKSARLIILVLLLAYILFGLYLLRKRKTITRKISSFLHYTGSLLSAMYNELKSMPRYARLLLMALLIFCAAKALWYIITIPLQYDEMWSYNYYIGNSFWQSFVLPHNNHTFYTLVAWFFHWLPMDEQINMRLPNLFAGLLLIVLFFLLIKKYFSIHAALISGFWFATCCPVAFYMLYARGYLFVLLFVVLALGSQLLVLKNKNNNAAFFFLFVSLVAGYWSNPVFLYAHVAIAVPVFILCAHSRQWDVLKKNILYHLTALLFIVLLYLPTLLSSHIHELLHAGVKNSTAENIPWLTLYYNSYFQLGFKKAYWVLPVLIFASLFIIFKKKQFGFLPLFAICGFIFIFLFSFLQSVPLAGHISIFLAVSLGILLAILVHAAENIFKVKKFILLPLLACVAMLNSYFAHTHHWLNWSLRLDTSAKNISLLLEKRKIRTCYLTAVYYKPHLEYYYKIHGESLHISMPDTVSHDYRRFNSAEEECIIIKNDTPVRGIDLGNYRELFRDELITAYIRNDIP